MPSFSTKNAISWQSVSVEDPSTHEIHLLPSWPAVYERVLGVLSVAREPLTIEQLGRFGAIAASRDYIVWAIDWLRQFLDTVDHRFRLYHNTVAEFLSSSNTLNQADTQDLYADPLRWHRQMADYYWNTYHTDWKCCDTYGLNNLAMHLLKSNRMSGCML
jgi:hypothetical protein